MTRHATLLKRAAVPRLLALFTCAAAFWAGGCARGHVPTPADAFEHEFVSLPDAPAGIRDALWVVSEDGISALGGRDETRADAGRAVHSLKWGEPSWQRTDAVLPFDVLNGQAFAIDAPGGVLVFADLTRKPLGTAVARLNRESGGWSVTSLERFPASHVPAAATVHGGRLFVVADARENTPERHSQLFVLRLAAGRGGNTWEDLGPVPGAGGRIHTFTAQREGDASRLYLSRTGPSVGTEAVVLRMDGHDPRTGKWRSYADHAVRTAPEYALPSGIAHVIHLFAPDAGKDGASLAAFSTVAHAWGEPIDLPTTLTPRAAVMRENRLTTLLVDDDSRPRLLRSTYVVRARSLHLLDYGVLGLFFAGLIAVSLLHSRRSGSADGYFRGGKRIPWLAAGLSVVATRLSSTSFVSIPAKSFATNLQYTLVPMTNVVGAFLMSRFFVRFFVRLNVTSGYEYLEKRFSPGIRTLGSLNYLAFELARIGLLILVPAVALAEVAKLDLSLTIVVTGLVATSYTMIGGIEGVVWADVFQIGVKVGGLLLAAVFVFASLQGNVADWAGVAWREGRLRVIDFDLDLTRDTIWVFLLFWLTDGLKSYVANQTIIQRFISTKDEGTAKRTIWSSALIGMGVSWLLLLIGTGLFLHYHQSPAKLDLAMNKPDAVFPWYIVFELPPGVVGLLIAALLAAAMSSLDGALNSSTTVIVTDFYRRFLRSSTDRRSVVLGRILTAVIGISATVIAWLLSGMTARSLFDQTLMVIGLFGGGLGGLFLLGMLTTRTSSMAALLGFIASAGVQYFVSRHTSMHLLTYMFTGMASCFVVGYAFGVLLPEKKDLKGLTVHTCQ